jgi:hypothetical protein
MIATKENKEKKPENGLILQKKLQKGKIIRYLLNELQKRKF